MQKFRKCEKVMLIFAFAFLFGVASLTNATAAITGIIINSPANDVWINDSTPDFNFTTVSNTSTSFSCELFIDNAGAGIDDSVSNDTATVIVANSSLSELSHNWYINCTDANGTYQSESKIVKIDTSAPATTASATNKSGSSYTFNTWTNSAYINITLSCSDGSGSGCDDVVYCTDSANSCEPSTAYSNVVQISTEGTTYIRYRSNDSVGNSETVQNKMVKIDATVPTTTLSSKDKAGITYSPGSWTNSSYINITLSCSDGSGSGCDDVVYCTDSANSCEPSTAYSNVVQISTEGTTYIRYRSNDSVGNSETVQNKMVKIDATVPTTTLSSKDKAGITYSPGSWTNSSYINITLSCSDGSGSGCDDVVYCTDSANSCEPSTAYSNVVQISTEGTTYIRYRSNDSVGNSETVQNKIVKIDYTAPNITSFTCIPKSAVIGKTINCICTATDNLDDNVIPSVTGVDTSSVGIFNATCTATDTSGNSNSVIISYSIKSGKTGKIIIYSLFSLISAIALYFIIKNRGDIKDFIITKKDAWGKKRAWKKYLHQRREGVIKRLSKGFLKPKESERKK